MNRVQRLVLAGLLVLSGLALIPSIGFPAERFGWQQFAGLYEPQPTLEINHTRGQRASVFAIRGDDFTPNAALQIMVNGRSLGSAHADNRGRVELLLTTDAADDGYYVVSVNQAHGASFWIDTTAPRWAADGNGVVFAVPEAIALTAFHYLPLVGR